MRSDPAHPETTYASGRATPWIPFSPLAERVRLRYHRIDPHRGEILVSVRIAPGLGSASIYHTGPVIAHTIQGAWCHREHDWVSGPGDTVHTAAGSVHTAQSVSDEETILFMVVAGEFLFFDDDGGLIWQESWKTSIERYAEHTGSPYPLLSQPQE